MIHHISISVENPHHVAQVLAEVMNGEAVPFFPHPGSYMVFPLETYIKPGEGEQGGIFAEAANVSGFTATHAAISVSATEEKIAEIGKREGWRTVRCNRDSFFDVIEFWLENKIMIELLTPEMANQYLQVTKPENLQQMFAAA